MYMYIYIYMLSYHHPLPIHLQIPRWLLFGVVGALVACIGSAVFRAAQLRGVWGIGFRSLQEALNENFDVAPVTTGAREKLGKSLW